MKKVILLLTVLFLCLGSTCAFADTIADEVTLKPFDHKVLSSLPGYSYDKFEKSWTYFGAYSEEYSDAYIVIGLQADGTTDDSGEIECSIYCWIRDENNRASIYDVQELMILADDTLIDCTLYVGEGGSETYFSPTSETALKYISEAKTLLFKMICKTSSFTLEPTAAEVKSFQTVAKNMYKYKLAHYNNPVELALIENLFPITIE